MNTSSPDWPQLFALFEHIVEAPKSEHQRLLDEATRDRPDLRKHLERLLELDASGGDLAADVAGWREHFAELAVDAPIPARIGAWRIVRELGAGGMGRVFLAERADGEYEQQVALKLIRAELMSDLAVARFLRERRILARLDHPGIATIVDGGVDADGRPWFAMQYVEGIALPDYCAQHALGVEARLRLMVGVCDAIAYAHRQLVVHCDLKPSNVLVDGNGHPRLLDFGIARMLEPRNPADTTKTQLRALTPGYAAPEQLAGAPLGVATDVYALGSLLHELLTGRRPYAGHDATPSAIAVAQAQGEPPPVSRTADDDSPVPARRLRGDLDVIVATALRHDPVERYRDAVALSDDLTRFMSNLPLHAHRASAWQQVRKFAGRHQAGVALAAAAVFGLIATTSFALHQSRVARHEAANAIAVRDFLVGIFRSADPRAGKGGIDTRTLIDRGSTSLDAALTSQPELAASFAEVLGNVYLQLAAYDEAEAMFKRALKLTGQRFGRDAAQNTPILRGLARTFAERNRLYDANKALARASAIDQRQHGAASPELVADNAIAADLAQRGGDTTTAEKLIDKAVQDTRGAKPADSQRLANLLNQRANIKAAQGALDDAERDTREALDLSRRLKGEQSLDVAENLINLGVLRMHRGDASGAELIFRRGLTTYRRLLPAEHPLIADAMTNLARALDREGKSDEAEPIYLDTLAMQRHLFGNVHADVATTLNNLAVMYVGRGDYAKARSMMQQVVDVWTRLAGPTHPLALASRGNLGVIEREQGDYAAARATLQSALADYRKQAGSASRQAYCLDQLGILLRYEAKPDAAVALHRQAAELRATVKQLGPIEQAAGLIAYSLAETAAGKAKGALAHADQAITLLDAAKAQGDPRYADALLARARAALAAHDTHTAATALTGAMSLRGKLYGADDWRSAEASLVAAEIDAANGKQRLADAKAVAARAVLIARRGASNPLVAEADRILGTPHDGSDTQSTGN